jgi:hypothetical protein
MITAAILIAMTNDISELTLDKNAFWEEPPLAKDGKPAEGVWIATRGGNQSNAKGINNATTADIYATFANRTKTEEIHKAIADWIRNHATICELSGAVGGSTYDFTNVRIRPATSPSTYGITENGNIVKIASALIYYDINH